MLYFNGLRTVNDVEKARSLDAPPVELVIRQLSSAVHTLPEWERDISLYPNPATDAIHVSSRETVISKVEMTDLAGRVVASYSGNKQELRIPVEKLTTGTFFVRIFTEKGVSIKKMNITH